MKSQEFIPEQELSEYSDMDDDIRPTLEKKGYKFLGKGVDQSAYLEPGTGYVLKVFGTQGNDTFSPDHLMFVKWANFCEKHKDNPFLPKFYGYDSFIFNDKRYLQIRQEALQDINSGIGDLLSVFADEIEGGEEGIKFNSFVKILPIEYGPDFLKLYKTLVKKIGKDNTQKLYYTIEKLFKISEKHGWTFDLHKYNFMQRTDGTPVIVDPWVV